MQTQISISKYLYVWLALFVLSAFSYAVDLMQLQGALRAGLITVFMLAKAGLIMAVFMHLQWERPALILTIVVPPLCMLVAAVLLALEAEYTRWERVVYFLMPS